MKSTFSLFFFFAAFCLTGQEIESSIADQVCEMLWADQKLRLEWIKTTAPGIKDEIALKIRRQEKTHTQRLKSIIFSTKLPYDEIPIIVKLILRSSDLTFQKEALQTILAIEDRPQTEYIFQLEDRILLRQNLPQRYGTHLYFKNGSYTPYPIENENNIDSLRRELNCFPMETYIQAIRNLVQAIEMKDAINLRKLIFNFEHGFFGNPRDYLYFTIMLKENPFPDKTRFNRWSFLFRDEDPLNDYEIPPTLTSIAFDHPAHGAIKTLSLLGWDFELEEVDMSDDDDEEEKSSLAMVYRAPSKPTPFFLADYECAVFLVPREKFQPPSYDNKVFTQVYTSSEKIEPVAQFLCTSFLEPLSTLGTPVVFKSAYRSLMRSRPLTFGETMLCDLLFDITLENENFENTD